MRNWANVAEFTQRVYAHPEYINTLQTSTAIADHVVVDFELRGCPVNTSQLVELISALIRGRKPTLPSYSVCIECKRRSVVCVAVARGVACLGPVTQVGCAPICPSYTRECFGCHGPKEQPNVLSLTTHYARMGADVGHLVRLTRNFNSNAPEFREGSNALEAQAATPKPRTAQVQVAPFHVRDTFHAR